jgi:amino acid transporter
MPSPSTASVSSPAAAGAPAPQHLRRALSLWDLILYGIIVIQPIAPMSSFGVVSDTGRGHVVTTILVAMVAMLLTAVSYGRMARVYPSAGSAFTYVGQEIHPAAGFVTGWSMVMDYLLNPMICIVWCSKAAAGVSGLPFLPWAIGFCLLFTGLNLRGIQASARFNTVLAAGMGMVIIVYLVPAVRYGLAHATGVEYFTRPFYDPARWDLSAVLGGTSVAVLTYIGFDGISTLSEEAENPRRNILLATVLTTLLIGVLSAVEVYTAQLVWPASEPFPQTETAFASAAGRAAGPWLFMVITTTLTVANTGSGTAALLGAARLLFGMGRSGALPRSFFGALDARQIPRNNVLLLGPLALGGAILLELTGGYDLGAHLLNFGALIAFMGVNLASFVRYFVRDRQRTISHLVVPLGGFAVCLLLWLNLRIEAKVVGGLWLAAGVAFGAWKTRGFRGELVNFDLPPEEGAAPGKS